MRASELSSEHIGCKLRLHGWASTTSGWCTIHEITRANTETVRVRCDTHRDHLLAAAAPVTIMPDITFAHRGM